MTINGQGLRLIQEVMNDTYQQVKKYGDYGVNFDIDIFMEYLIKALERDSDTFDKNTFVREFMELSGYEYVGL